jgi:alpha-L-arabinofuranosidase
VLTHHELNAHNTFETPGAVAPKTEPLALSGAELRCTLAPASVTRFDDKLG